MQHATRFAEASARESLLDRLLLNESVRQFYHREADLLDRRGLKQWIELFADDATYTLPLQRNVKHGQWDQEARLGTLEVAWMADTREVLGQRVEQALTGVHWAEEPMSRFTHIVSNVSVLNYDAAKGEAEVRSRFLVYRNRCERETDFFAGIREDVLVRDGPDDWKIQKRVVFLQQNVLLAKNISLFF